MLPGKRAGWYELRISSQGYYELLRYDNIWQRKVRMPIPIL
jgi:hypothetical protein